MWYTDPRDTHTPRSVLLAVRAHLRGTIRFLWRPATYGIGVILLFAPLSASAAIAFDATSTSGSFATSPTFTHVISGTNNLLMVACVTGTPATSDAVTGITYNGSSLTKLTATNYPGSGSGGIDLWYKIAPATGSHSIAVTSSSIVACGAESLTGALQSSFPDAQTTVNLTTTTQLQTTVTTVANNDWTAQFQVNGFGSSSAGSGTTVKAQNAGVAWAISDSNGAITPAGSNTLTTTIGGSNPIGGIGVAIAPVAVATAVTAPGYQVLWYDN